MLKHLPFKTSALLLDWLFNSITSCMSITVRIDQLCGLSYCPRFLSSHINEISIDAVRHPS